MIRISRLFKAFVIPAAVLLVCTNSAGAVIGTYRGYAPDWWFRVLLNQRQRGHYAGEIWVWPLPRLCAATAKVVGTRSGDLMSITVLLPIKCTFFGRMQGRDLRISSSPRLACVWGQMQGLPCNVT
jgi:hypothetical protein